MGYRLTFTILFLNVWFKLTEQAIPIPAVTLDEGVCESKLMELNFGTRIQVESKIELYYTWCGHNFCYKTRQKVIPGGKMESYSEWQRKKICCEGYQETKRGVKPIKCQPICNVKCINANCTKPNVCTCLAGYGVKTATECTPICANHCINGECTGPNVCTCNEGFSKDKELSNMCLPVCEKNCTNGFCAAPNKCQCLSGFVKGAEDHVCEPKCDEECTNAMCIAPNTCKCKDGYALDLNNRFKCYPVCVEPCVNGYCSSPNECVCNKGYALQSYSKSICQAVCKSGCVNGMCVAPDICSCNDGYHPSQNFEECVEIEQNYIISSIDYPLSNNTDILNPIQCMRNSSCDLKCFSNQEYSYDSTDSVCYDLSEVKITYNCPCDGVMKCFVSVKKEYLMRMVEYKAEICDVNDVISNINVEIVPDEEENKCEICYCSSGGISYSDIHNNATQFKFSICSNFTQINIFEKQDRHEGTNKLYIILAILLGAVIILVSAIASYVAFTVWKRRRRVDYDLGYKERENCHENSLYERSQDLVSDDDSEDNEN